MRIKDDIKAKLKDFIDLCKSHEVKYLSDILRAIDLIDSFIADIESFEQYQLDFKTQSAVERQLGIVGEAVNKFKQDCPDEVLYSYHQPSDSLKTHKTL